MVNQNAFKANPPDTKVSAGKTDPVRPEFRADPDLWPQRLGPCLISLEG